MVELTRGILFGEGDKVMDRAQISGTAATVELTHEELAFFSICITVALEVLDEWDIHSRAGVTMEEAESLRARITALLHSTDNVDSKVLPRQLVDGAACRLSDGHRSTVGARPLVMGIESARRRQSMMATTTAPAGALS